MTSGRKMGFVRVGMQVDRTLSVIDAKNVRANVPSETQPYKGDGSNSPTPGEEREQSKEKHE